MMNISFFTCPSTSATASCFSSTFFGFSFFGFTSGSVSSLGLETLTPTTEEDFFNSATAEADLGAARGEEVEVEDPFFLLKHAPMEF